MKPLESSRWKESQKCSKIMFNKPAINKWGMCKKIDLKESMENFTCVFD